MAVTVEITQSTVLEPSRESARGGGKKVPLTVFDRASTDGYIPAVFAWNAPAPTNEALKAGLVAAVARFPHLAGRFAADDHSRKCFHLNDAGVLVLEATVEADLADALAHDVSAHINELYPKAEKERANEPIFQAQLTRYACGGLVIGTACHHQVADDGGEELASTAATPGTMFCPDLEVDSWLGFRFHDLDFGCGPPCAFLPPDLPIEGIMIFVPSCDPKGGVDLFMALDDEHVQTFKQICYSMD
ncbi:unnamed protein product [Triticum turgidum subsp. durum]|uniref:Uncharacterized protein n=1 Tax=Triticum turgidum subsp. durum TaxID=4567 RepID=A0A9R0Q1F9_TRITD|nr:unnamed protein product [Triticum turgidum subsp. durum]